MAETNNRTNSTERSYLSAAVETLTPWGSRTATPKPATAPAPTESSGLQNQHAGEPRLRPRYFNLNMYPQDCPSLNVRWFYAVDVSKRNSSTLQSPQEEAKPKPAPKKLMPFSAHDSRACESAYQQLAKKFEEAQISLKNNRADPNDFRAAKNPEETLRVPVHEDFLFDVDIAARELIPVYWTAPVYETRRGTWFYADSGNLRPCDEALATQIEEAYLKEKPFRYSTAQASSVVGTFLNNNTTMANPLSKEALKGDDWQSTKHDLESTLKPSPAPRSETHRLFGPYTNTVVTFQDPTIAWLSTDALFSRMSSTVYQTFGAGGHLAGTKIVRGYSEPGKTKDSNDANSRLLAAGTLPPTGRSSPTAEERARKSSNRRSAPPTARAEAEPQTTKSLPSRAELEAEASRKSDEREMRNDYNDRQDENQEREITHLVLVTHGIGQRLGHRTERMNFIHDVNILRQTLKTVYANSADLQALNLEVDQIPKNCRIQVLPVCWRQFLDFPKMGVRQNRQESDVSEALTGNEDPTYPSLESITLEGVPYIRTLLQDLVLDILLYQNATYREHISKICLEECNRIYQRFIERNTNFNGKVYLLGHSLGSAIFFDLLCRQQAPTSDVKPFDRQMRSDEFHQDSLRLDFDVEDFFALGSPIGLFQMLKGRTIAAPARGLHGENIAKTLFPVSTPKVSQIYNIIHPTDPVCYRLEPLISTAMSEMKPQNIPYTKKGIFGSKVNEGITQIGVKVGGLWSSLSSGITNGLISRSLGLSADEVERVQDSASTGLEDKPVMTSDDVRSTNSPTLESSVTKEKMNHLAKSTIAADREGISAPTLIDDELETLFAGFQKARKAQAETVESKLEFAEAEEKSKRLRVEEMKIRALNRNGRVDYTIQESMLGTSPLSTLVSHMSYWSDEDVSHFIQSQLLSRHRGTSQSKHDE